MKKLSFIVWRMSKTDLRTTWFALRHADRPGWFMPAIILLTMYFFAPFNLALPLLGIADDFVLVPLMLHALITMLPVHVRQAALQGTIRYPRR
ncbi:hypothetical protein BCF11_0400 [Collimonas sp. PA-H2]|uniref:hypothetical protein n=1 Tax=Collimonas sp. PA-H2 TaxID=1881062 RepID=UPI000BF5996B|nr:hypothetical protein [Collimonas sp. PA-H2]PFH08048.1 hypothetical protein BCF11_0400 [Collimonas sp. PA-H2]